MTRSRQLRLFGWLHPFFWCQGRRERFDQGLEGLEIQGLTPLLEFLPLAQPPVGLLAHIEERIDRLEGEREWGQPRPSHGWMARREVVAGLTGALISAAAATVIVLVGPRNAADLGKLSRLAILASAETERVLIVDMIEDGSYLRLQHSGAPMDPSRALELWVIPSGDGVPRSLGVLDRMADVTLLSLVHAIAPGDVLALSDEPAGGSPTGIPTGPVLVSAAVGHAS